MTGDSSRHGARTAPDAVRMLERDRDELVGFGQRCRMRRVEWEEATRLARRALGMAAEGFHSPHSEMPYVLDRFEEATRMRADAFDDEEAAVARDIARIDGELRRERTRLRVEQSDFERGLR